MSFENDILVALRRIVRAVDLRSQELTRQHGITGPQLLVLRAVLRERNGLTVGELARSIELSQPTTTGIISRLEKRGLVVRERAADVRRMVRVKIADAGRQLVSNAPPLLQEQFMDQINGLPAWERSQMLATLQRIVSMLGADELDAAPILTFGTIVEGESAPPSSTHNRST